MSGHLRATLGGAGVLQVHGEDVNVGFLSHDIGERDGWDDDVLPAGGEGRNVAGDDHLDRRLVPGCQLLAALQVRVVLDIKRTKQRLIPGGKKRKYEEEQQQEQATQ